MQPSIKRLVYIVVLFGFLIITWIFATPEESIIQPINYNHKLHIEQAELECIDCHLYVETNAKATIPNIEVCSDCHSDEPMTESPEEKKLLEYISSQQRIPWVQIYKVPNHVYFSHRRHVQLGEIECSNCHGNVSELEIPAPTQLVKISMDNCIICHKENDAAWDCIDCHY